MEEEVHDIPLSELMESCGPSRDLKGNNLGHLEFEIHSDDGFTCRADTIDGKIFHKPNMTKTVTICHCFINPGLKVSVKNYRERYKLDAYSAQQI